MTAKKINPIKALQAANDSLEKQNSELVYRVQRLEEEANARMYDKEPQNTEEVGQTIDGMARGRGQDGATRPRRHATPGGPNFPDDIYPPGCGPLQLVWSQNRISGDIIIGTQGDSFHHFRSKEAAVSWLIGIAQRILTDVIPER